VQAARGQRDRAIFYKRPLVQHMALIRTTSLQASKIQLVALLKQHTHVPSYWRLAGLKIGWQPYEHCRAITGWRDTQEFTWRAEGRSVSDTYLLEPWMPRRWGPCWHMAVTSVIGNGSGLLWYIWHAMVLRWKTSGIGHWYRIS